MEDEQGESARPAYKNSGWPFCARFLPAAYFSAPVKGCGGIASMSIPLALPPFPIPGEGVWGRCPHDCHPPLPLLKSAHKKSAPRAPF